VATIATITAAINATIMPYSTAVHLAHRESAATPRRDEHAGI
jgi:hypothetical protein